MMFSVIRAKKERLDLLHIAAQALQLADQQSVLDNHMYGRFGHVCLTSHKLVTVGERALCCWGKELCAVLEGGGGDITCIYILAPFLVL